MTNLEILKDFLNEQVKENVIDKAEAETIYRAYETNNLQSYSAWEKEGKTVKKGEHAAIKLLLWLPKPLTKKQREEEKESGIPYKMQFIRKWTPLFFVTQVEETKKTNKSA